MAVESAGDLASFFGPAEFAVGAIYSLARGGDTAITGIFDAGYTRIAGIGQAAMTSVQPTFTVRTSDLPAPARQDSGDTVRISGVRYKVVEVQPSDDGAVSTLILSR
jgi:hypothetical protein